MRHLSDEQLRKFLGGQLEGVDRLVAERHLETCAECRRELDLYRAIDEVVVEALPTPDWMTELLLSEVSRRVRQDRRPWWLGQVRLLRAATAAAALALMLGAALYAQNVHYWHGLERQNQDLYAEHYSLVVAPQSEAVRNVSLGVTR